VSILDEQYNSAQLAIQRANERIAADERELEARQSESASVREQLAARGAELYMGAGNPAPLAALDVSSTNELGSRSAYATAAADSDRQLLDRAKVAIEQLGLQQQALQQARAEAQKHSDALDSARQQIEQATAEQQQLLSESQGRIATLVDQVRAEREAAAEAAARAEMQREAAAQARAAEATTTQQPTSNTGGSSGTTDPTVGSPGNVPAPNPSAQVAVDTARAQLGKPYVYAAAGPDSFDCSGLTMYAWAAAGVSLPHNAEAQYQSLPHVSQSELQPGDLVFFGSPIHHVGIYVGGGTMIEAPYTGVDVRYHTIYRPDYAGAARP
jgi:cell wall-associated NlpC family hydrolase